MSVNGSNGIQEELSDIQKFYEGSTIFMTGATGFLGQVMLYKLMTACPNLKAVYILVREKGKTSPTDRFEQLFSEPIKRKIELENPNCKEKIKLITGDCMHPNLGLSQADIATLKSEVEIVFHIAATVRFNAPLPDAVNINVRCTRDLLNLAKEMGKLKAFVYVSTAFSHCSDRTEIKEQFYETPISADKLITLVKELDEDIVEKITPYLLKSKLNTYVYTKAVAEDLCRKYWNDLPILLYRPSIVISTVKEPFPGWINNIYGPTGVVLAAGVGLLRSIYVQGDFVANVVPCDYVINCLLACTADVGTNWRKSSTSLSSTDTLEANSYPNNQKTIQCQHGHDVRSNETDNRIPNRIYNYSSSCRKDRLTWNRLMQLNTIAEKDYPFMDAFRTVSITMNRHQFVHYLYCVLFHLIPAFCIDQLTRATGKESKLVQQYSKVHKMVDLVTPFANQNWTIYNDNVQHLWNKLSDRDKDIFSFDINQLDWLEYFRDHVIGIRSFVLKDPLETIPAAKQRKVKLLWINRFITFLACVSFFYLLKFIVW